MLRRFALIASSGVLLASFFGSATASPGQGHEPPGQCAPGARTLSQYGDHVYPDMGNGGYTSLHTDVRVVYDAPTNQFLPGNHVVLTDRATQCLSELSLDFERSSVLTRA